MREIIAVMPSAKSVQGGDSNITVLSITLRGSFSRTVNKDGHPALPYLCLPVSGIKVLGNGCGVSLFRKTALILSEEKIMTRHAGGDPPFDYHAGLDMVINPEVPISSNRAVGLTVGGRRYFAISTCVHVKDEMVKVYTCCNTNMLRYRSQSRAISKRDSADAI
jgi:hypothetical protein